MDRKGEIGPVVATILMVAITVVLVAVLYVMVIGYEGDAPEQTHSGIITSKTTGYDDHRTIYLFVMDNGHTVLVDLNTWDMHDEGQWYEYTADQIRGG